MQLVHLAVVIVVTLVSETSGERTYWFCKKTRTGEACRGAMRRFNAAIARYVGGNTDAWACSPHWTRINREANRFCACPLPVHSDDIHALHIPERFHQMFNRIGHSTNGYCPGVRWCCRRRNTADEVFKSELDYSPPAQVSFNDAPESHAHLVEKL